MPSYALLALTLVGSAIVAFALTPIMATVAKYAGIVDKPGGRKAHPEPIPLLGGIAVLLAIVMGGVAYGFAFGFERLLHIAASEHHSGILVPALLIFLVGLADDARGVSPAVKVAVQAIGAAIAIHSGLVLDSLWTPWGPIGFPVVVSYPLTVLWFVGVTNAFNLMDGLDGLLASVGTASMLGIAFVAIAVNQVGTAFLPLAVAGGLIGFLPWNWHKARIFLGDSGSLLVGYLAAALSLKVGRYTTGIALHVMLALCFLPALETFLSIARRYVSGRPIFSGDGGHVHHVLVRHRGISVQKAVLALALAQVVFSGIAVVSRIGLGWWAVVPAVVFLLVAIALVRWVDYVEFRVLWHRFIGSLRDPRRKSLASAVILANAGRQIRRAGSVNELSDVLESVRADLELSFLALEFTEGGQQVVGACSTPLPTGSESARRYFTGREGGSCWVFSGEGPPVDPEDTSYVQTIAHRVRGEGGKVYGRLVCQREGAGGGVSLNPEDVRRYLVWPLGATLQRLGSAGGRKDALVARVEEANG